MKPFVAMMLAVSVAGCLTSANNDAAENGSGALSQSPKARSLRRSNQPVAADQSASQRRIDLAKCSSLNWIGFIDPAIEFSCKLFGD
jgi:hypothetical protein